MKNILNLIGMNQLKNLMTWVLKKKYLEVFTVMVSTSHLLFNKKVFFQLFKVTILSLKLSLEQVRPVLSPFQLCKLLILPVCTHKLWLLLQLENFPFKVPLWYILSENTIKSKFMHVLEEPVSEKTSKFSRVEFMSLSEHQVEFMIWWKKVSLRQNISDSLSWTKLMKCFQEDSKLRSKKYSNSCQETSK
mgnify:CR=1 FL=1